MRYQSMATHLHKTHPNTNECLITQDTGAFHQKTVSKTMQENMATDPSMMVDMMKKNVSNIIPQV